MRRAPEAPLLELLNRTFNHRELDEVMTHTRRVLESQMHLPLQIRQFTIALPGTADPGEEAFRLFKRCVTQVTGLGKFGMVLAHHARQLGSREYFEHVGLFLDKLPFIVTADTELADFADSTARLHKHGCTYLGLESAARRERAPLLPPLDYEIQFNFRAYAPAEQALRTSLVDVPDMQRKLREHHGILFEASAGSGRLSVECAFRGESSEVDRLLQNMTGEYK
jgi:hypothetical protein